MVKGKSKCQECGEKKREARLLPRTEELSSKKCVDVFEIKFIQLTFLAKEFLDPN
jgi:hypothetical protein